MMKSNALRKSLRTDAQFMLDSCLCWNSREAARRMALVLDRALARHGLTSAQFGLMAQIATLKDDALTALAARTGLEQSSLSRSLRMLERHGLVEIAVAPGDLRRKIVWLTEKGATKLEKALPAWQQAQAKLEDMVSVAAVQKLARQSRLLAVS